MFMMTDFELISLSWEGIPDRTFLEDAIANDTQSSAAGNLGAHLVLTTKKSTMAEPLSAIAAATGILPLMEKNPMLAMILAVALLAAISPVDLHVLDDIAGETLALVKKLSRKLILDKKRVKGLVKVEAESELAIQRLIEFGLLRIDERGDLVIQRKIISNIKVSLRY